MVNSLNPPLLAPSILSADFARLGDQVSQAVRAGADLIHVDVMDGHFVPNLSIGIPIVESLIRSEFKHLDVHLMVREPEKMIPWFFKSGVERVSFHFEAAADALTSIRAIQESGRRAGVALCPPTPVGALEPLLPVADYFLIMTVAPGFGGQTFIPESIDRVRTLRAWLTAAGLSARIEVDGGVNPETAKSLREAGADIFVAGNFVFRAPDIAAAMAALRAAISP